MRLDPAAPWQLWIYRSRLYVNEDLLGVKGIAMNINSDEAL